VNDSAEQPEHAEEACDDGNESDAGDNIALSQRGVLATPDVAPGAIEARARQAAFGTRSDRGGQ
jgi:hypothetical protein